MIILSTSASEFIFTISITGSLSRSPLWSRSDLTSYAADIALYDGSVDSGWDDAAGSADVEWFALASQHHRNDGGVAGDASCCFDADGGTGVQSRVTGRGLKVLEPEGDGDVWFLPGNGGQITASQRSFAEQHQRIGALPRRRSRIPHTVLGGPALHEWREGGLDGGGGFGIEAPADHICPVDVAAEGEFAAGGFVVRHCPVLAEI